MPNFGITKAGNAIPSGDIGGNHPTLPQSPYDVTGKGGTVRGYDALDTVTIKTTGGANGFDDMSSKRPAPNQP